MNYDGPGRPDEGLDLDVIQQAMERISALQKSLNEITVRAEIETARLNGHEVEELL